MQWFRPGDHPDDALSKGIDTIIHTPVVISSGHGDLLDLHPGDFILTFEDGHREVLTRGELYRDYEPVPCCPVIDLHHPC